jgi:hypothetical protein
MGIIALSISSRQQANGLTDPDDPACPVDPGHPLVKNGHYWRHADTLPPDKLLTIQRYQWGCPKRGSPFRRTFS